MGHGSTLSFDLVESFELTIGPWLLSRAVAVAIPTYHIKQSPYCNSSFLETQEQA
jgi:hypothetical protein